MPANPGATIGPYTVIAKIGEGGMGEVYQARDTKLDRDVALKVLPEAFTSDPDRLARFEREAKVLASLNHPNIGSIYGLEEAEGVKALVLELVEGPTLADRIAQGPIPVDEALPIAMQIAEALEAAHEQGIIHRDLKPANIKVREDGTVKVLDFGLAKALDTQRVGDPAQSPTLTAAATQMGVIMGTAAYMSPEQARGKPVDKRSDIWAFGCVLFEMLVGERAFHGEDVASTVADVIRAEVAWDKLPGKLSPALRGYLERCLAKDVSQRVRDIGDVRLALDGAFDQTSVSADDSPQLGARSPIRPWHQRVLAVAAVAGIAGLAAFAAWHVKPAPPRPVTRLAVSTPPGSPVFSTGSHNDIAISPDGSWIVYKAVGGALQLRALDQLHDEALVDGIHRPQGVFISPDGSWVGFANESEEVLQRVSLVGGPPRTICDLPGHLQGASWGRDEAIIFATDTTGLLRVPADGGVPEPLTNPETDQHSWPHVLPNGKDVLFTVSTGLGAMDNQVALLNLETATYEVIIPSGGRARYSVTGHILYGLEGAVWAVPFDLEGLRVTGDPRPVAEGVVTKGSGAALFDISTGGALAYVSGSELTGPERTLVWVDRDGREEPLPLPPRNYLTPSLSPDGRRLAVTLVGDGARGLWVYDVVTAGGRQLTSGNQVYAPVWTSDGERIVFALNPRGGQDVDLYWVSSEGGEIEALTTSDTFDLAGSVTPDGSAVLFTRGPLLGTRDLWELSLADERPSRLVVQGGFTRSAVSVSPNGDWLAYDSDQSGQLQVYLRPYASVGETVQVSADGGLHPRWSADGSELYYRIDERIMAVDLSRTDGFGMPTELFRGGYILNPTGVQQYDVAPDGRFLMLKMPQGVEGDPVLQVVLVQNWFPELERLVPTN